jgi:hypothetical protein
MLGVLAPGLLAVGMFGLEDPDTMDYVAGAIIWRPKDLHFEFYVADQAMGGDSGRREYKCSMGCKVGVPLVGIHEACTHSSRESIIAPSRIAPLQCKYVNSVNCQVRVIIGLQMLSSLDSICTYNICR